MRDNSHHNTSIYEFTYFFQCYGILRFKKDAQI